MNENDPETKEEWQEAVEAAKWCYFISAAKQYGLITGLEFDLERAEELLKRGRKLGFEPRAA